MQLLHIGKRHSVVVFQSACCGKAAFQPNVQKRPQPCALAGKSNMLDAVAPAQLVAGANANGASVSELISHGETKVGYRGKQGAIPCRLEICSVFQSFPESL